MKNIDPTSVALGLLLASIIFALLVMANKISQTKKKKSLKFEWTLRANEIINAYGTYFDELLEANSPQAFQKSAIHLIVCLNQAQHHRAKGDTLGFSPEELDHYLMRLQHESEFFTEYGRYWETAKESLQTIHPFHKETL